MTDVSDATSADVDADLTAAEVSWDLETLLPAGTSADDLFDQAELIADELERHRSTIATLNASDLAAVMTRLGDLQDLVGRAGHWVSLRYSENTADPERGAAMAAMSQRSAALSARLLFIDLEWASADAGHAEHVEADPQLAFCAHHLALLRQNQPHLLTEVEETLLTEKSVSGRSAWVRLFSELTSAIEVDLDGETQPLEAGLSMLAHPDSARRSTAAAAVTQGLEPGLRTRAYVYNNLMLDKSIDDRLRSYPSWISSRNVANEASDASVDALIEAVVGRYDIPQRWYALKAQVLGVDRLNDWDRMASVADGDQQVGWAEATSIVRDSYGSFSGELADIVDRFIDESWIDAPVRPGKRPGAFCAYAVPSHHPYVFLNWTGRTRDVLTLAHELGHGVHMYLSRQQGVFHQATPLTLAETASVFGETVTNNRLVSMIDDPGERFALLAASVDDAMATVFRQIAMNRFEDSAHNERRDVGELSVERFGELWASSQTDMLGDAVNVSDGYRSWWSYIPHFMGTPGYVYAYAYGQLLALSVYARYEAGGDAFVPQYLDLLRAGGSMSPEELGAMVDCDLGDPGFWDAGLAIIDNQLTQASEAAAAAGRL